MTRGKCPPPLIPLVHIARTLGSRCSLLEMRVAAGLAAGQAQVRAVHGSACKRASLVGQMGWQTGRARNAAAAAVHASITI
eukprot:1140828-Pelagomonas_calceolata.AAC.3